MTPTRSFAASIPVAASPERVKAWFTSDVPQGREFESRFRGPLGVPVRVRETFTLRADGAWGFETRAPFGIVIRDEFRAVPVGEGQASLDVRCEVSGLLAPLYAPLARRTFRRQWAMQARECERDGGGA